ncbi:ATP-binding protein [Bacillus sp. ISL-35]|nr:ATP-binding protein [Bacillus sp. ISL-35]
MAKSINEVLEELRKKSQLNLSQSQVDKSAGSEEKNYQCPKCRDQMGYIEQRNGQELWVRCSCVEWRRAQKLMKASEITDEFKNLGFKNFITDGKPDIISEIRECALTYLKDFENIKGSRSNSIALLGQPGAGKTHLLTAIANNLMKRMNVPVLYFPYVEGFNDLKDDFDKLEEKLERMKQVDVLFIDDLFKPVKGKPRATEWQVEQTYAVINYRYLNHKPLLISSELTVDELADVDEALGTRIYQMCKDYTVLIKGDRKLLNHRLAGAPNV